MPLPANSAFGTDLPSQSNLLRMAGHYWHSIYPNQSAIRAAARALQQSARQGIRRINEHVDAVSPETTPLHHVETFWPIEVSVDEIDLAPVSYGSGYTYGRQLRGGKLFYGQKIPDLWRIPLPSNVAGAAAVQDRPYRPTNCLVNGLRADFRKSPNGTMYLLMDQDPLEVFERVTTTTGTNVRLWLYMAEIDEAYLYRKYGILLGRYTPSVPGARTAVSAIWDSFRRGSTDLALRRFLAGLTRNEVAEPGEKVVAILQKRSYAVVTDRRTVYSPADSEPVVAEGDVLSEGDFFFDSCRLTAFERGEVPGWLEDVEIPASLFGGQGPVIVPSGTVPLSTLTSADGVDYVAGSAVGEAEDVEKLWLAVQTEIPIKDPMAPVPSQLDVLAFLAERWFQYGVSVSLLKSAVISEELCGMLELYRELIPPWFTHVMQFDGPTPDCWQPPNECSQ